MKQHVHVFMQVIFITKGSDGKRVCYSCDPNVNLSTMHIRLSSFIKHNGHVYAFEGTSRSVVKMTFNGCIVKAYTCTNKHFNVIDVREDCVHAYDWYNVCTSVKLNLDLEEIENVIFDMHENNDPNTKYHDEHVLDRDRFICQRVVNDDDCSIVIFDRERIIECIREIKHLDGDKYTFKPDDHIHVLNNNLIIVEHKETIDIVDITHKLCLHRSNINSGDVIKTISETEFNIREEGRVACCYVSKYDESMVKGFCDIDVFSEKVVLEDNEGAVGFSLGEKVVLEDNEGANGFSLGELVSYMLGWDEIC